MFCAKCGKEIDNDSTFCPFCGQKVDAPVENKKEFRLSSSGGIRTAKLIGGTVIGLVVLISVAFGVSRFAGRPEEKEVSGSAEMFGELTETAGPAEESTEQPEDSPAEPDFDVSESEEENLYSISTYTLCNRELKDFFELHIGCYADYYLGNCNVEPVNISSMLEHTKVVGAIDLDTGMRVISDYSDNVFSLNIDDHGSLMSAMYNKSAVNYRCDVFLKESNILDTFRYYKGTDAQIGIVAEIRYYIDEKLIDFKNKYAVVSLRNSAQNPGEWLIAAAILISENDYKQVEGKSFDSFLVNEDMAEVEIEGAAWKQSYLEVIKRGELDDIESYCLKDINDDGTPELYVDFGYSYEGTRLYYVLKDGSVKNISVSGYYMDKVHGGAMRQGAETDTVYQYDHDTGDYLLIFDGYFEDDYSSEDSAVNHTVNGRSCSAEEYKEQLSAVWNPGDAKIWWDEMESVSNRSLLKALDEY